MTDKSQTKQQTTIPELMLSLGKAKQQREAAYRVLQEAKEIEDNYKALLHERLIEIGLKTAKTQDGRFTASLSQRTNLKVVDEAKAIDWLKQNKLDIDFYTGLKTAEFKSLADARLKETGEIPPGTEQVTSESLSFRENKPKGERDAAGK